MNPMEALFAAAQKKGIVKKSAPRSQQQAMQDAQTGKRSQTNQQQAMQDAQRPKTSSRSQQEAIMRAQRPKTSPMEALFLAAQKKKVASSSEQDAMRRAQRPKFEISRKYTPKVPANMRTNAPKGPGIESGVLARDKTTPLVVTKIGGSGGGGGPKTPKSVYTTPEVERLRLKVVDSDQWDDDALEAEVIAWLSWYRRGGNGAEPTIPEAWKSRLLAIPTNVSVEIRVENRQLEILTLNAQVGWERQPPAVTEKVPELPTALQGEFPLLGGLPMAGFAAWLAKRNLPTTWGRIPSGIGPYTGGTTTHRLPTGRTRTMGSIWGLIKQYGPTVATVLLTDYLVEQGLERVAAEQQAQAAVASAKPPGRRRRRRMLTCSDKEDIMFLKTALGSGQLGRDAITALLSSCKR